MKIQIIGFSGAGKSTLAKKLGDIYQLDVLHLDSIHFEENWVEVSSEEMTAKVRTFMDSHKNGWIIDGKYSNIAPERFTQADIVIFLNFNRFFCYKSAKKRYKMNKGTSRDDLADGCIEKFDFEFKKWILYTGRTKKRRRKNMELISNSKKAIVFKNRRQVEDYLAKLIAEKITNSKEVKYV